MSHLLALDTSVAVPLLVATHSAHPIATDWLSRRRTRLSGHANAETYAVLTRLPGDLRLAPADAALLMRTRFGSPLTLLPETQGRLPALLADLGIVGGAVYDALVAVAALEHDAVLATRDARARGTYEAVGARVEVVT